MRARQTAIKPLEDGDPRHGTSNGYTHLGCRCDECRAAQIEVARRWRTKRPTESAARARAYTAAAAQLRERHRDEYDELVEKAYFAELGELRS